MVVGAPVLGATLLALRGDTEAARAAVQRAVHGIDLPNCRSLQVRAHYALGAAALAEGDHAAAYNRFRAVYTQQPGPAPLHFHASDYYLADLVAAAVRTGRAEDARLVLDATRRRLTEGETSTRLDAIVHRAEALLAEPDDAERHFAAALADPAGDQWPFERAQVRLDYAEWLRRRRRAVEARPLLAAALEVFERARCPPVDRARPRRTACRGRHPGGLAVHRPGRARRTHPAAAADRAPRGGRSDQPGDRRTHLPLASYDRLPPLPDLPQARHHLASPTPGRAARVEEMTSVR